MVSKRPATIKPATKTKEPKTRRYNAIIEGVFFKNYTKGATKVRFSRTDFNEIASAVAKKAGEPVANLPDTIYYFRHRLPLPESIRKKAPENHTWVIRSKGKIEKVSEFAFEAIPESIFAPREGFAETKVPEATPGIIAMHAKSDEQALLAKLRYNRLIDIFTGVTCYSLQSHFRTQVGSVGQVETDEIYVGVDQEGIQYVLPVQAKGGRDKLGVVQIEQDIALCEEKFPGLTCIPIGAQFMRDDVIALFTFEKTVEGVKIASEKHYRLVAPEDLSPEELAQYRSRRPSRP